MDLNAERDDIKIANELNSWQHDSVILKSKLTEIEAIKGTILDPSHKNTIWKELSETTLCLKPGVYTNKETNKKIEDAIKQLNGAAQKKILAIMDQAKIGDERVWKLIVSPEAGYKVNLKEHAIKFMANIERDLGRKLHWFAIDHYNTASPHLHFCIRGVDQDGHDFRIDRDYVKEGARKISKDLMTQELGLRTDEYILERRAKVIKAKYITDLDRIIEKRVNSDHFITIEHGSDRKVDQEKRQQFVERLEFLETLGLARKDSSVTWYVEPTFLNFLKLIQEQNDVLKLLNKHQENILDKDLPLVFDKLPNKGDRIIGRLIGTGLIENNEDFRYILLEGIDGQNHYITAPHKLLKIRDNGQLFEGYIVYLERRQFKVDGKEIRDLDAAVYTDFNAVRLSTDINNIDRYIIERLIKDGQMSGIKVTDNQVRKDFLKTAHFRLNLLKNRDILDENLEVNFENFRLQYGRHL